jgi:hypothetical protein
MTVIYQMEVYDTVIYTWNTGKRSYLKVDEKARRSIGNLTEAGLKNQQHRLEFVTVAVWKTRICRKN